MSCVRPEGIIFPKFAWRYPLRAAALAAGLEPDRASQVKPYDFRHSVATELTERSGNLLGVGYLLGHRHATTTNQYVHARRRAAESVLLGHNSGHIESSFEVPVIGDRANPPKSLQCEEQDSNLHVLRTLEPKSSAVCQFRHPRLCCDFRQLARWQRGSNRPILDR